MRSTMSVLIWCIIGLLSFVAVTMTTVSSFAYPAHCNASGRATLAVTSIDIATRPSIRIGDLSRCRR
jgi:hypothetical protein